MKITPGFHQPRLALAPAGWAALAAPTLNATWSLRLRLPTPGGRWRWRSPGESTPGPESGRFSPARNPPCPLSSGHAEAQVVVPVVRRVPVAVRRPARCGGCCSSSRRGSPGPWPVTAHRHRFYHAPTESPARKPGVRVKATRAVALCCKGGFVDPSGKQAHLPGARSLRRNRDPAAAVQRRMPPEDAAAQKIHPVLGAVDERTGFSSSPSWSLRNAAEAAR